MKYFELTADREIANPIRLLKVDGEVYKNGISEEEFKGIPPLSVGYFENLPERELYDVLQEPAFLISDRVKRLVSLYEPMMEFKGIPVLIPVDCLSSKAKIYDNGMIEELVLDEAKSDKHHIFRVGGILEHKILVSLPLAESMLRRRISGISFVPVRFL